jgi:Cu(I)/Ag(I) efflux system membrane fusion protein
MKFLWWFTCLAACSPADAQHAGMDMAPPSAAELPAAASPTSAPSPRGYAQVPLTGDMAKRLDLTTAAVALHKFQRKLWAYGAVVPDETRTSHVHAKVRGWIETIEVDFTGREVKQGDVLCTIYSPEVYSAQLELLSMLASPAAQGPGEFVQADRQIRSQVIAAAKRRLQLWDVPADEIQRLVRTRKPVRTFTLRAPASGTVTGKQALAGLYVDAASELFTLSDLTKVWVEIDLTGQDALHVKVGDHLQLTLDGATMHAPITFLAPSVDEATRTVRARVVLDNGDRRYRPGTFVTAELAIELGESLGVPAEAVVRTGTRNLVFVVLPTHVEPREVQLGETADGWVQVTQGLKAAEIVATAAQFLLDSESRVRASSGQGGGHAH